MTDATDVIVRPVVESDHSDLCELARRAESGLTSLPNDPELLRNRILAAREAFRKLTEQPNGEQYLFVAEEPKTERVIGTAGLISRVGGFEPFYAFRIETERHRSDALDLETEVQFLDLVEEHDGPCELNTLFVHPEFRGTGIGVLLSRSRLLYISQHPERFDDRVIAELRGPGGSDGPPPFWEGVSRIFFPMDFDDADTMTLRDKTFITELAPDHSIYVPLLPEKAQHAIGKIHPRTEPAAGILRSEGFQPTSMVDIFDAGLILSARRDAIYTVSGSEENDVGETIPATGDTCRGLLASGGEHFRATIGDYSFDEAGTCGLTEATMNRLDVGVGDKIRLSRNGETA